MSRLSPEKLESAVGFVLAGGQSSRMGADKALELCAGKRLIQIALSALAEVDVTARIAGSRTSLSAFAVEIPDIFPNAGPMGGILSGLTASASALSLFLPVDLPLMPASLLANLLMRARITGAPVTATSLNGRLEPFPVVLHRSVLGPLTRLLQSGQTACHRAWQTIPAELESVADIVSVEILTQAGQCQHPLGLPPAIWFHSANTPSDLAYLNRLCRNSIP